MKLKEFSTIGELSASGIAAISFNKRGLICINTAAAESIGIKKGDRIAFYQDEDNPEDWYFRISTKDGALLRDNKSKKGLKCYFAIVVSEILKSTKNKDIAKFQISTTAEDGLYAIITRKNIRMKPSTE